MNSQLDNLNSGLVASLDRRVLGQRNLWKTHGARVRVVGRANDLESGNHGVRHVGRASVWAVVAKAHVDKGESRLVAAEPTGLKGNGAACRRPVGAIRSYVGAAA